MLFVEKTPKLAFCFLTYANLSQPALWDSIFREEREKLNVYIHNKYPFIDTEYNIDRFCIPNCVVTEYGTATIVDATLMLFKQAFQDWENDFFVLLSDKCIPMYSFSYIYDYIFQKNQNIINTHFADRERYWKITDKSFICFDKFIKHDQWIVLNRRTVSFFLQYDFMPMFRQIICVDEHYFGNICDKYGLPYMKQQVTFVNWYERSDSESDRPYPKTFVHLTNDDIRKIRIENPTCLFMRKVSPLCILPDILTKGKDSQCGKNDRCNEFDRR